MNGIAEVWVIVGEMGEYEKRFSWVSCVALSEEEGLRREAFLDDEASRNRDRVAVFKVQDPDPGGRGATGYDEWQRRYIDLLEKIKSESVDPCLPVSASAERVDYSLHRAAVVGA